MCAVLSSIEIAVSVEEKFSSNESKKKKLEKTMIFCGALSWAEARQPDLHVCVALGWLRLDQTGEEKKQ